MHDFRLLMSETTQECQRPHYDVLLRRWLTLDFDDCAMDNGGTAKSA